MVCARDILTCSTGRYPPVSPYPRCSSVLRDFRVRAGRARVFTGRCWRDCSNSAGSFMLMLPPDPGSSLPVYLVALGETLSIALLGTTLAAMFALPVCLLAARNIVPSNHLPVPGSPLSRYHPRCRYLDLGSHLGQVLWDSAHLPVFLRSSAAISALWQSLFSEAIEAADKKPGRRGPVGRRPSSPWRPVRLVAAGASDLAESGALLLRIEYAVGDHYRHRRGRRNRPSAGRTNPGAGMAKGIVPDSAYPRHGNGDRLDFRQTPFCDHRTAGNRVTSCGRASRSRPETRPARRQSARAWSAAVFRRHRRRCCRPPEPGVRAQGRA